MALRTLVLIALDVSAYVSIRALIRQLRDRAILGESIAETASAIFPYGSLHGGQLMTATVIGLWLARAYDRGDGRRDPVRLYWGVLFGCTLALWSSFWTANPALVLVRLVLASSILWGAVAIGRFLFDLAIERLLPDSGGPTPFIFVGDRSDAYTAEVVRGLGPISEASDSVWIETNHSASDDESWREEAIAALHQAVDAHRVRTIIFCGVVPRSLQESILETATTAGVRVLAAMPLAGVVPEHTGFVWYHGVPFLELVTPSLVGWKRITKRLIDVMAAGVGLVLLAPVFLVIAVLIRLDTAGPIFFRQHRVGYGGRVFPLWKFRTMRVTAEAEKAQLMALNVTGDPRLFKIPNDPRVTRVGRWLRRLSLDELPQLINVFTGEMSLVGPRPFFPEDLRSYNGHHFARLGVKPGITGLWQVRGRSDVVDFEEVIRFDREYAARWSVTLDLWILLQTIPVVLRGRGAY